MSILFPVGRKVPDRKYHESGVRGRFEPNLRITRGRVDTTAPTVLQGVGFTVVRTGAGAITVTFDPIYAAIPMAVVTGETAGAHIITVYHLAAPTTSTIQIARFCITDNVYEDGILEFATIGPIT